MPEVTEKIGPKLPTYDQCVRGLRSLARERSEWAGLPMIVEGFKLRLEPRFPYQFNVCSNADVNESPNNDEVVNSWWCDTLMAEVFVVRTNGGKPYALKRFVRGGRNGKTLIDTLACAFAWLPEAESKAMSKLAAMITPHAMRTYCMTGMFLESSQRSKVTYLFRRLRPTLALSGATGKMRILCALCLHPIGYYDGTHAGVMVPTDEVLAHLTWMRGDEKKFWAQANQHAPNDPNAGL